MTGHITDFYAGLTPLYHLIYPDWDASIARQATALDSIIRETWGDSCRTVLDVSCGIGTQSIGLAILGYQLTASDLSDTEVNRAKEESTKRSLNIRFSVADMRNAFNHHAQQFNVVMSCDNSIPHLLSDDEILLSLQQFFRCTLPGGGCIISVRDYAVEDLTKQQVRPYGVRNDNGTRWSAYQVWEPHGEIINVTMYFVADDGSDNCNTKVFRTKYYAVSIDRIIELMTKAGYLDVRRIDNHYFQPLIVGTKKA